MDEQPTPHIGRTDGTLRQADAAEQREILRQWRRAACGMDGERGRLPEKPDDPVAYKLLDAAGDALSRGDRQQAANILRLVARDYHESREAACARSVLDRLTGKAGDHGR